MGGAERMALPPHIAMDLAFSIAMFFVAVVALRYTLFYMWSIDIFDFRTLPAKIVGGIIGLVVLGSVFATFTDANAARRLGRKVTGTQYAQQELAQQQAVQDDTVRQVQGAGKQFRRDGGSMVGYGVLPSVS